MTSRDPWADEGDFLQRRPSLEDLMDLVRRQSRSKAVAELGDASSIPQMLLKLQRPLLVHKQIPAQRYRSGGDESEDARRGQGGPRSGEELGSTVWTREARSRWLERVLARSRWLERVLARRVARPALRISVSLYRSCCAGRGSRGEPAPAVHELLDDATRGDDRPG